MDNIINQVLFKNQTQAVGNKYRIFYDEDKAEGEELLQGQVAPGTQQAGLLDPKAIQAPVTRQAPAAGQAPAAQAPAAQAPAAGQAPVDTVTTAGAAGVAVPAAGAGGDQAAAIVADYMLANKKGAMKPADIITALGEKGVQARAVEIDGRKGVEVLDKNGNVVNKLRDTDGNGTIGVEDKEFVAELKKIGYNRMDEIIKTDKRGDAVLKKVEGGETATAMDNKGAVKAIGEYGKAAAAPGAAVKNPLDPLAVQQPEKVDAPKVEAKTNDIGGPADQKELLKQIQAQLTAMGFIDKTAEELFSDGTLNQVAGALGIYVPERFF
jgi:hypothetical protein